MHVVRLQRLGAVEALQLGYGPFWDPPLTVRLYRVGDLLIDSGARRMVRAVRGYLERRRPSRILLTHHHEDHSGNAAMAQHELGVQVLAPAQALDKLARGFPILPYQHFSWGQAQPVVAAPLPARVEGERCALIPIHTPGHSRDHTAFLEPDQGWLFSGDLYLADRIKVFRSDERIDQQIASLRRVLQHDFDALFCAHRPHPTGGRARLQAKLAFLEDFVGEIAALTAAGDGEQAILRRLRDRESWGMRLFTMGNVSFAHMLRSALQAQAVASP